MQQVGREFLISRPVFVFFLGGGGGDGIGGGGCSGFRGIAPTPLIPTPTQSHAKGPFCITQLSCSFQANIGTVLEATLGNCIELDLRVVLCAHLNFSSCF